MLDIWSLEKKYLLERELWILIMKAQSSQGFAIPSGVIDDYEKVKSKINLESIASREQVLRHDVKARIEEFNSLAGHQFIHLGLTSRDVTDNVELFQIRESLRLIERKSIALLLRLASLAEKFADLAMVGRTHNVPAQVTTLGKRYATWAEELLFATRNLQDLLDRLPLRGIKGALGTSLDQIELIGDSAEVLDEALLKEWGFSSALTSSSQVYPRSMDFEVVSALAQLSAAPSTIATNIRLMSGFGLVAEGFAKGQVGSSAMPHKVNPRLSERINSLSVILKGFVTMAASISGEQWNEGDVACSAVRRVVLPDSFYVTDAILDTCISILDNLEVFESEISLELEKHLPLMLTTRILMLAVKNGVGREEAHEMIKSHARESQADLLKTGKQTFLERVEKDARLKISGSEINALVSSPLELAGKAPHQARKISKLISGEFGGNGAPSYSPEIRN